MWYIYIYWICCTNNCQTNYVGTIINTFFDCVNKNKMYFFILSQFSILHIINECVLGNQNKYKFKKYNKCWKGNIFFLKKKFKIKEFEHVGVSKGLPIKADMRNVEYEVNTWFQ